MIDTLLDTGLATFDRGKRAALYEELEVRLRDQLPMLPLWHPQHVALTSARAHRFAPSVDGRWGASLELGPVAPGADPRLGRHPTPAGGRWGARHRFYPEVPRLLLYDLERDPFVRKAVNAEHPELVGRYKRQLVELWKAHRALATRFESATGDAALDPEQLKQLKALGYIQ